MLRLVFICAIAGLQLSTASVLAQSSSSSSSGGSSHGETVAEAPSLPVGPSIQAVPREWQSSRNTKPGDASRSTCQSDHTVGGFCLLN